MAGGIYGAPASFPVGGRIAAADGSYTEMQKQLGNEIQDARGKKYRLVQAATAATTTFASHFLAYADTSAFTVELAGAAVLPCGVGLLGQDSLLTSGDLFWCQIEGEVSLTDDGGGDIIKSALIITAAAGEANLAPATAVVGDTVAVNQSTATPAADAVFTAMLLHKLVGVGDA